MRPGGHAFQIYRTASLYWWRLISSNGRPLGCAVDGVATPDLARRGLADVVAAADLLTATVRATPEHRWTWTLQHDAVAVVRGVGSYDRHVRCEMAWRRFVLAAPLAFVDDEVHEFHRGSPARRVSLDRP